MRKIFGLLLLVSLPAGAQQLTSGQVQKKTGGGVQGDSAGALVYAPYRGTSAPASPDAGMLWFDTTASPPTLKTWSGSAWLTLPTNSSIPTQTDASTFPSTPSDGQVFFAVSTRALYVYSATDATWTQIGLARRVTSPDVQDVYSTAVLGAPGTAPTATRVATGGGCAVGNHAVAITFANSTGGETLVGPAATVACSVSTDTVSVTNIPTGPTGTTQRRIYITKAGADAVGPFYWSGTLNDNTTTTYSHTRADSALVLLEPAQDHSAPLPSSWTCPNTTSSTTSGGCGVTAAGELYVRNSETKAKDMCANNGCTSDPAVKAVRDVSAYTAGNFTITYRVLGIGQSLPTFIGLTSTPVVGCMRVGTADNGVRQCYSLGRNNNAQTMPINSSNIARFGQLSRTSAGAAESQGNAAQIAGAPQIDSFPFWIRIVKRGSYWQFFRSQYGGDGPWAIMWRNSNSNPGDSSNAFGYAYTQFELPAAFCAGGGSTDFTAKIDSWTLTVD